MPEYEVGYMAGLEYIKAPEGTKIWIVIRQYPGGLSEQVSAWFSEKLARAHAGHLVGRDGALISLQTIDIKDKYQGKT